MPQEYADHITVVFDSNHRLTDAYVADEDDNRIIGLPLTGVNFEVGVRDSRGSAAILLDGSRLWLSTED